MENILDENLINIEPEVAKRLFENIRWWERRRFYYNLIVFFSGFVSLVIYWNSINISDNEEFLVFLFVVFFLINFVYTQFWAWSLFRWYYFENSDFGKYRKSLFIIFQILSAFIVFFYFYAGSYFD